MSKDNQPQELSGEDLIAEGFKKEGINPETLEVDQEPVEAQEAEPTQELSEIEQEAYAQGWRPEGGDKTAEQFLQDGVWIDRIKEKNSYAKKLAKQNEGLQKQIDFLVKKDYERSKKEHELELKALQSKREEAEDLGDIDLAREIDDHLEQAKSMQIDPPALLALKDKYSDILTLNVADEELDVALDLQDQLIKTDQLLSVKKLPPEKHWALVEQVFLKKNKDHPFIKQRYLEDTYEPEEQLKGPALISDEPTRKTVRRTGKPSYNDLKPEYKHMCDQLVEYGALTQEEYIKELIKAGNIKEATKL